jgi:YD repeat-containing protein
MSDLAQWNVHGPVETLRTEWAEWDPAKEEWQPIKRRSLIRFRTDGQIAEIFDGSNSRTTYTYNQAGQILGTRSESEDGPFKTIYSYDGSGRLVRTIVIDENGNESGSEVFNYDAGGRKNGNPLSSRAARQIGADGVVRLWRRPRPHNHDHHVRRP